MSSPSSRSEDFDGASAVTRSLLGWGVVAGPFYVVVGLVLALTREGFDPTRHALSLLTLGEHGWIQRACLVLSGLMVAAAACGILRALRTGRGLAIGMLTWAYGLVLILSAIALPDPGQGFPPDSGETEPTTHGIFHLVFGGLGFLCLAAAAIAWSRWAASRRASSADSLHARLGLGCGIAVLAGFLAGAALAESRLGVALLWVAVLAGWFWLALACARLYTLVPHPVVSQRAQQEDTL